MLASMLLVGVAAVSGIVLNLLTKSPGRLWQEPAVWFTLAMFGWLLLHVVVGAFYRPMRQGRKVAYFTLVSFIFLVFALMTLTAKHGGAAEGESGSKESGREGRSHNDGVPLKVGPFCRKGLMCAESPSGAAFFPSCEHNSHSRQE